ncbi:MAG: hypothetical protein GC162_10560 [Planctomycetes bacterium]|nr:hypothetical protein [Planctomycetota bacterium]
MRSQPSSLSHASRFAGPLKEEGTDDWRPDRISDRKLIELSARLTSVQRLGGTFARIAFSPAMQARLDALNPTAPPQL